MPYLKEALVKTEGANNCFNFGGTYIVQKDFVLFDSLKKVNFLHKSRFQIFYAFIFHIFYAFIQLSYENIPYHTSVQYLDSMGHYDRPLPTFFLTFNHLCIYGVALTSDQSVICHSFRLVLTFG